MKILCEYTDAGPSYVRSGWGRVLQASGHHFFFWDPSKKSAFDAFAEADPDVFLGTSYGVDRAVYKNIVRRPHMKVALVASAWGPLVDHLDRQKYPLVFVTDKEKRILQALKEETGKPDFVFLHVSPRFLDGVLGGWRQLGIEPVGILNACDTFVYCGGQPRPELRCDVGFCGGYWPYKARNLDRFLLPLCHPSSGLDIKLFGNRPWPVAPYLGVASDTDVRDLFVSATVCPNVSEPHSTDLGFDVVERPYKVLGAGGFCVSDFVQEAQDVFGTDLLMAQTPQEFEELIRYYVARPEERSSWIQRGQERVLREHTYWERVAQMLGCLGLEQEKSHVLARKQELLGGKV